MNDKMRTCCSTLMAVLLILAVISCGGAPPPAAVTKPEMQILSENIDQAGRCVISIKLQGTVSEAAASAAAESVINTRKAKCPGIVVRSYVGDSNETPYLVSIFDGAGIKHEFARQTEQQRIPTH